MSKTPEPAAQSKFKHEMDVTRQIHDLLLTVDENRREAIFKAVCILLRIPVN